MKLMMGKKEKQGSRSENQMYFVWLTIERGHLNLAWLERIYSNKLVNQR